MSHTTKVNANSAAKMSALLDEIVHKVFEYLNAVQLTRVSTVSKQWKRISNSMYLWRALFLRRWPSQRVLYKSVSANGLNWHLAYQEVTQKSWFSPDDMKYFVQCKTIYDEPVSEELRQAVFSHTESVSRKWMQVFPYEHDEDVYRKFYNQNMELYYDTCQLRWVFLDRRRGFADDNLGCGSRKKRSRHIRPYQVIPSCLAMYRWLCMFKCFATAEVGLTFYRIWRFRLKHIESGMIFELCDWKAAMSSTFQHGAPKTSQFKEDALELLSLLTHPHFIMHPLGLGPHPNKIEAALVSATAGGAALNVEKERLKSKGRNERRSPQITSPGSEVARGRFCFEQPSISSHSSLSSVYSESCSDTDDERNDRESDLESEAEIYENGYVTNCEYFINISHQLNIELQHALQASTSDAWMVTRGSRAMSVKVVHDPNENSWILGSSRLFSEGNDLTLASAMKGGKSPQQSKMSSQTSSATGMSSRHFSASHMQRLNSVLSRSCESLENIQSPPLSPSVTGFWSDCGNSPLPVRKSKPAKKCPEIAEESLVEPIPSCLALYRLICLFDLNCSMYTCLDDDACIWSVNMMHKKTGGIVHFKDINGWLQVNVTIERSPPPSQESSGTESTDDETASTSGSSTSFREDGFDFEEFKTAVVQLLDLLMDDKFSHPYGTIAGSVA